MTYLEALNRAIAWTVEAENDGDREARYLALSDGWLKVAAEIRAGAPLTVEQVDRKLFDI